MANKLNIELKGKVVEVRGKSFKCLDGFGCSPTTNGCKIYGVFTDDIQLDKNGKEVWDVISGYEVEKIIIQCY